MPSYVSPTAAAAEDLSSGSGERTESMSSVRGEYVSGEPLSNSGSQTVESTSVGQAVKRNGASAVGINMTVDVKQESSGELYAELYFRLNSEVTWSNGTIQVHLASETCNLKSNFPHCREPNRHKDYLILADSNKVTHGSRINNSIK